MMIEAPPDDSIQVRTLRAFTVLHQLRSDWGRALILSVGLDPQGAALALASNIAGAVSLTLEADAALAREALRSGACDFVVNTLDEALRAIKNEVRKGRPLSVGLQGEPAVLLLEILERGVLPELFTRPELTEAAAIFEAQGVTVLNVSVADVVPSSPQWRLRSFTFSGQAERRDFDTRALDLLSVEDRLRRKWLDTAPRVLPREAEIRRVLWLTDDEAERLLER